jgi:alpha-glucosidase (family GH31 glycosyl hydrolase)
LAHRLGQPCECQVLEINTTKLRLRYTGGAFSAESLSIAGDGGGDAWQPGSAGRGNLNGTFTSKDCGGLNPLTVERCINKWQGMMQPGLLTRDFGVLIDDTRSFLLDGDRDWPPFGWRKRRRNWTNYTDHTFFGHGRNYKEAMREFILLSGQVQLMPYRHHGFIFSDHQSSLFMLKDIEAMVTNFSANDLPLNYLVLDENWHYMGQSPSAGQCSVPSPGLPAEYQCGSGFGGFTWDRTQVPDPAAFQRWIHARNLSLMLNVHDQCGYDACQRGYAEARAAVPRMARLAANATVPCEFENAALQAAWFEHNLESGENAGVDSWWTDLGDMSTYGNYSANGAYTWAPGTYENWRCLDDMPGTGTVEPGINATVTRDVSTASTLWSAYVKNSRQLKRGTRGLTLGVYGGLGHHRLPMVGSGDTYVTHAPSLLYTRVITDSSSPSSGCRRGQQSLTRST